MNSHTITNSKTTISSEEIDFFMKEALNQCSLSIKDDEVPVGCVFVYLPNKKIIAQAHNETNKTKNASAHCEINCIKMLQNVLLSKEKTDCFIKEHSIESFKDIKELMRNCALFVSCEPCIMCAYALSLANISKVYYGCDNEKFGGNGSIMSIHKGPGKIYDSYGGYFANESVELFKEFYQRGNAKAPENKRQRKLI